METTYEFQTYVSIFWPLTVIVMIMIMDYITSWDLPCR